ncbi:hypothetical protein A142_16960 [Vibrio splendidus 12E03]|uniref:Uncharacterized protein n=1 Tax=Vibrio splendidus 12E03 TaxID=1191305 RepID=A0A1E5FVQ5_VIBSP|nr:hypothetical protein A142_16960 [Vibrio splendidus 12E03]
MGHKLDRIQLNKAIEIIETLLEPELKSNNGSDGACGINNGKVIDLVVEIDLFSQESLSDFSKNK